MKLLPSEFYFWRQKTFLVRDLARRDACKWKSHWTIGTPLRFVVLTVILRLLLATRIHYITSSKNQYIMDFTEVTVDKELHLQFEKEFMFSRWLHTFMVYTFLDSHICCFWDFLNHVFLPWFATRTYSLSRCQCIPYGRQLGQEIT
jgi:hypothetical protein